MYSLFDENFKYTDAANAIDRATSQACKSIIDEWLDFGYSPREIEYIMKHAINDLILDRLLNIGETDGKNEN